MAGGLTHVAPCTRRASPSTRCMILCDLLLAAHSPRRPLLPVGLQVVGINADKVNYVKVRPLATGERDGLKAPGHLLLMGPLSTGKNDCLKAPGPLLWMELLSKGENDGLKAQGPLLLMGLLSKGKKDGLKAPGLCFRWCCC